MAGIAVVEDLKREAQRSKISPDFCEKGKENLTYSS